MPALNEKTNRPLYTPESLWQALCSLFAPAHRKAALLSAFVGGLLCHLYILTNMLPEHDWQYNFYADQRKIMLGRWLLKPACAPSSNAILPWVTGLLVLAYLALAAVLMVELLEIRSPVLASLTGLLMATLPCVASGFAYMFTTDGYFLSILLAVAAARLAAARSHRLACIALSALCLGCSMGIYQAYAGVTLTLFCAVLVLRLLREKPSFAGFCKDAAAMGAAAVLGAAFYFVMLQVSLAHSGQSLADYQGISDISGSGSLSLAWLLNRLYLVFSAWRNGLLYLIKDLPALGHSAWCGRLVLAFYAALAVLLVLCAASRRLWTRPWAIPAALVFLGLIPLGTNYVEMATNAVNSHLLMRYSVVVPFLLVLALTQLLLDTPEAGYWPRQAVSLLVPVLALALVMGWTVLVNMGYTNMQYQYERVYSNMVRMSDRIQQTEGYHPGMSILISDSYAETLLDEKLIDVTGLTGLGGIEQYDSQHYMYFLRNWCGLDVSLCEHEQSAEIRTSDEFLSMPAWPATGCTQVINDVLVIKTSPTE